MCSHSGVMNQMCQTRSHQSCQHETPEISFPNHTPHTPTKNSKTPPYLSLHVGLLWSSGAMSRRGAGVHASPTGGLRTEGLEWPSACTLDLSVWEEWQFHQKIRIDIHCHETLHHQTFQVPKMEKSSPI